MLDKTMAVKDSPHTFYYKFSRDEIDSFIDVMIDVLTSPEKVSKHERTLKENLKSTVRQYKQDLHQKLTQDPGLNHMKELREKQQTVRGIIEGKQR